MPRVPYTGLFGYRLSTDFFAVTPKMWSYSLIILVLGAVGISGYERKCPENYELKPCTCTDAFGFIDIRCSGRDITVESLKSALESLHKKTILILSLSHLTFGTLPSTLFQDIDTEIKQVSISYSKIGSFSDGDRPFLGLENSLETLEISRSTIGGTIKLGHLQSLRILLLKYSAIPEINGDWFEEGIPSLRTVVVMSNTPRKIRSDAFGNLTNLHNLYIEVQTLGKLERSLLPNPSPALETLALNKTQTSNIADDFLTNMPALKTFELQENKMSTIDESVFKPIWEQLDLVSLRGNPIVCDSSLNWLLPVTKKPRLLATCQLPEELRGRKVGKLPEGKTEYDH